MLMAERVANKITIFENVFKMGTNYTPTTRTVEKTHMERHLIQMVKQNPITRIALTQLLILNIVE